MAQRFSSVDEYVAGLPEHVRAALEAVRRTVLAAVPASEEAIRYQMPTLTLNGVSVLHYAGWKQHISLYPAPAGDEDFERRIAAYRSGASTVRFPLSQPVPLDLVGEVARLQAEQATLT